MSDSTIGGLAAATLPLAGTEPLPVEQGGVARRATVADIRAGLAPLSHTHGASAITDFAEAVDDRVAALLVAGANVTLNYNDAAGTLTVSAAGGGGSTDLSYDPATRILASSTGADVTLPIVAAAQAGLAPASGGGASNYLRADGAWASPLGALAAVATSGSAADLGTGVLPSGRINDTSHGNRGGGALHAAATTSAAGFMAAADKAKIDGIEAGAQVNVGTDLSYTAATRLLASSTGADVTIPLVGATEAGLAPASGGGTATFLRADGTWAAPPGGGGGSPGGSPGQVQFNDAGAFAGAAGLTVETGGRARLRDYAEMDAIATPATPLTGRARWYARQMAGRVRPYWLGPSGVDYELQPGLAGNRVGLITSNNGSGLLTWGTGSATVGTGSAGSFATTSLRTTLLRANYTSAATAGSAAAVRSGASYWRGNAPGRGGFDMAFRFATGGIAVLSGAQFFAGVTSSTAYTGDPSTTMANLFGIGKDTSDANWQVMRRAGTGTAAKIDTGVAYATGQVIDLFLFAAPGGASIFLRAVLRDWAGDTVLAEAEYTSDLPADDVALAQTVMVRNGTTASAVVVEVVQLYAMSDY